jgi:hypothetical protein
MADLELEFEHELPITVEADLEPYARATAEMPAEGGLTGVRIYLTRFNQITRKREKLDITDYIGRYDYDRIVDKTQEEIEE